MSESASHLPFVSPLEAQQQVLMVFLSPLAIPVVEGLAADLPGVHLHLCAPISLMSDDWVRAVSARAANWSAHYILDFPTRTTLDLLAFADVIHLLLEPKPAGPGLVWSLFAQELVGYAMRYGVPFTIRDTSGRVHSDPATVLPLDKLAAHIEALEDERRAFTASLSELQLFPDFESTGLWDMRGRMYGFEQLDLPFDLVRALRRWVDDWDHNVLPDSPTFATGWEPAHAEIELSLARQLQRIWPHIRVYLCCLPEGERVPVDQVTGIERLLDQSI